MSISRCAPQLPFSARVSGLLLGTLLLGVPLAAQAGRAYVSDEDDNAVSVIDTDRDVVIATVDVGKRPRGLKLSRDGAHLYVAVSGLPKCPPSVSDAECAKRKHDLAADGIADVDTVKLKLVRLLKAGTDPEQFDISTNGQRLFISNEDAATVSVLNVASGAIEATIPVGREPEGARDSPNGRLVVVTSEEDNSIAVIDARSLKLLRTITVGKRPRDAAFTPDGAIAYVTGEADASVYRATLAKDEPASRLLQLRPEARPMGVVLDSAHERLYVSTGRGATVAAISLAGPKLIKEIPVGARPWGIALSSDGRRLYSANGSSNDVSVVDTTTLQVVRKIPVGHSPWGIVLSP